MGRGAIDRCLSSMHICPYVQIYFASSSYPFPQPCLDKLGKFVSFLLLCNLHIRTSCSFYPLQRCLPQLFRLDYMASGIAWIALSLGVPQSDLYNTGRSIRFLSRPHDDIWSQVPFLYSPWATLSAFWGL